jgi:hypothetical protein
MLTLGIVVSSLVASLAPTGATCGGDPARCEPAAAAGDDDAAAQDGEGYATPAVVDCRSSSTPFLLSAVLPALVGECDGGSVYDASYRASRSPGGAETEVTRALLPATRDRRRTVATCGGLPPRGLDLTVTSPQPLAVFATPRLVPAATRATCPPEVFSLVSRFGDPPDRPPRV